MADFTVVASPDEFTIVDKTDDWVIFTQQQAEFTLEFVAVSMNDAGIAVAAKDAAIAAQIATEAAAASIGTSVEDAEAAAAAAAASASSASTSEGNAEAAASTAGDAAVAAQNAQAAAEAAVASIGTAVTDAQAAAAASAASAATALGAETGAQAAQVAAEAAAALATSVIPTGGTTGQALVKASNADYDYTWASVSGTGDMVAAIYDPTAVGADAFARANHHGTQLAATISDFSTAADARISAAIGTTVQAYSANLTTWAGIAPSANVVSFNSAANYAAMRTALGVAIGSDVQAYSANLTTYAGIAPSANVQSLLGAADYAAMRTQLSLVVGTNVQAYSANLTTWAGIAPSANVVSFNSAANYAAMRTLLNVADGADVTATAWAPAVVAATAKTTPVDADNIAITDSAASNVIKKVTWANVKATLKTYFDTLYQPLATALTSWAAVVRAAGFDTFAATPSSANLRSLLTDETGTGSAVFATSPAITTPALTDPVITGAITEDVFTITDGAGFVINPRNGSVQEITLGANRTPTVSGWVSGDAVYLKIADGTAFTITWTTIGVVWIGGSAPTLATTGWTHVVLWRVGSVYYGKNIGDSA